MKYIILLNIFNKKYLKIALYLVVAIILLLAKNKNYILF